MDVENFALQDYAGRESGPELATDPWDGVQSTGPDGVARCVYCGCPHSEHGGESAMLIKPGRKRRIRLGLRIYWCRRCAADKGTERVICYSAPGGLLERVEQSGWKLSE